MYILLMIILNILYIVGYFCGILYGMKLRSRILRRGDLCFVRFCMSRFLLVGCRCVGRRSCCKLIENYRVGKNETYSDQSLRNRKVSSLCIRLSPMHHICMSDSQMDKVNINQCDHRNRK